MSLRVMIFIRDARFIYDDCTNWSVPSEAITVSVLVHVLVKALQCKQNARQLCLVDTDRCGETDRQMDGQTLEHFSGAFVCLSVCITLSLGF